MDVVARGQPQAISANMRELVIHIFLSWRQMECFLSPIDNTPILLKGWHKGEAQFVKNLVSHVKMDQSLFVELSLFVTTRLK